MTLTPEERIKALDAYLDAAHAQYVSLADAIDGQDNEFELCTQFLEEVLSTVEILISGNEKAKICGEPLDFWLGKF